MDPSGVLDWMTQFGRDQRRSMGYDEFEGFPFNFSVLVGVITTPDLV